MKIKKQQLFSTLLFIFIIINLYLRLFPGNNYENYSVINNTVKFELNGKINKIFYYLHSGKAHGIYIMIKSDTINMYRMHSKNIHDDIKKIGVQVGDSISKKANNDTVYFYSTGGYNYKKVIID